MRRAIYQLGDLNRFMVNGCRQAGQIIVSSGGNVDPIQYGNFALEICASDSRLHDDWRVGTKSDLKLHRSQPFVSDFVPDFPGEGEHRLPPGLGSRLTDCSVAPANRPLNEFS